MAKKLNINLQNLPPAARIAIAIIPTILVVLIFYFAFYKPLAAEIKKLDGIIVQQQKEIAKNEAKVAKLPELKKKFAQLERALKILSAQLPEEKEISDLLKQISDYGVKSGLTIALWKPGSRNVHSSGIVYEIPVQVKMNGNYHSLGMFYSRLTGINRIVNVKDIKLKHARTKEKLDRLNISFRALTFSAIPEAELQQATSQQKGPRGGRSPRR